MKYIEITETKVDKLSGYLEDAAMALGKAMHCIEEMREAAYGERKGGYRSGDNMYENTKESPRHKDYDSEEIMTALRRMLR